MGIVEQAENIDWYYSLPFANSFVMFDDAIKNLSAHRNSIVALCIILCIMCIMYCIYGGKERDFKVLFIEWKIVLDLKRHNYKQKYILLFIRNIDYSICALMLYQECEKTYFKITGFSILNVANAFSVN